MFKEGTEVYVSALNDQGSQRQTRGKLGNVLKLCDYLVKSLIFLWQC